MKTTMTVTDLRVGMVLTTQNGSKYAVVADDEGSKGVININDMCSNALKVGGVFGIEGGNSKGGRNIVKVEEFSASPSRNRLSEALKIGINRAPSFPLVTVWQLEDPAVTKAKADLADAQAAFNAAQSKLNSLLSK